MSTATAMDLSEFDDEYRRLISSPVTHKPAALPDGRYQVLVENFELTQSRTGMPMAKWTFRVTDPPQFANRLLWKNTVIQDKTLRMLAEDLQTCGVTLGAMNELHLRRGELLDVPLEVTKRTKGEYDNLYLNRRLDLNLPEEDDTPF